MDRLKLDNDINTFFNQSDSLLLGDKKKLLKKLIEKYTEQSHSDFLINYAEFKQVIDNAKSIYAQQPVPLYLCKSNREYRLSEQETLYVALLQSFIGIINKNECLKKFIRLGFQKDSAIDIDNAL